MNYPRGRSCHVCFHKVLRGPKYLAAASLWSTLDTPVEQRGGARAKVLAVTNRSFGEATKGLLFLVRCVLEGGGGGGGALIGSG